MIKKKAWIRFWRDEDGYLRVRGETSREDIYFKPAFFSNADYAIDGLMADQMKNIPQPVRITWEEEEE